MSKAALSKCINLVFAIDLYTEGAGDVVDISGLNGAKNLETICTPKW